MLKQQRKKLGLQDNVGKYSFEGKGTRFGITDDDDLLDFFAAGAPHIDCFEVPAGRDVPAKGDVGARSRSTHAHTYAHRAFAHARTLPPPLPPSPCTCSKQTQQEVTVAIFQEEDLHRQTARASQNRLLVCLKIKIGRREKGLIAGQSNAEEVVFSESDIMQVPPSKVPDLRYSLLSRTPLGTSHLVHFT